jgi:hypothetical protein
MKRRLSVRRSYGYNSPWRRIQESEVRSQNFIGNRNAVIAGIAGIANNEIRHPVVHDGDDGASLSRTGACLLVPMPAVSAFSAMSALLLVDNKFR